MYVVMTMLANGYFVRNIGACYFNSSRLVITVMPADSHSARRVSRSRIFVCPRYNTGCKFWAWAIFVSAVIGDGFCFPAANHVSMSAIQKSGSSCVAIAIVGVSMMLSWVSHFIPCDSMYLTTGFVLLSVAFVGCGVASLADVGVSSKFISENVGVSIGKSISPYMPMPSSSDGVSKSVGNGSVPGGGVVVLGCVFATGIGWGGVAVGIVGAFVLLVVMLPRSKFDR